MKMLRLKCNENRTTNEEFDFCEVKMRGWGWSGTSISIILKSLIQNGDPLHTNSYSTLAQLGSVLKISGTDLTFWGVNPHPK